MENFEYTVKLEQNNNSLKKMIQQTTLELHKLIEYCLDWTEPQEIKSYEHIRQAKQNHLQSKIKNQMTSIALEATEYNESLLKLSQGLIEYQLKQEQSNEMGIIIKKYQEKLLPLRSQHVQKENQLYYTNKRLYESYEDSYRNCTPSVQKLGWLQTNYRKKLALKNEVNEIVKQLKQFNELLQQYNKENNKKIIDKQSQIIEQYEPDDQQYYQQQVHNACDREISGNFPHKNFQSKDKQCSIVQNQLGEIRRVFTNKSNTTEVYNQNLKKLSGEWQSTMEQSTSVSFKNSIKKREFEENKMKSNPMGIPNFAEMPKSDYHLFAIYYEKIERQQQRYQKLLEQYNNYKHVFELIDSENRDLKAKINEKQRRNKCQKEQTFDRKNLILDYKNQCVHGQKTAEDKIDENGEDGQNMFDQLSSPQIQLQLQQSENEQNLVIKSDKSLTQHKNRIIQQISASFQLDHQILQSEQKQKTKYLQKVQEIDQQYENEEKSQFF